MKEGEVYYRLMTLQDVQAIMEVEKASFSSPWTEDAFHNELLKNHFAYYIVAEVAPRKVVGYCGVWIIVDEGHITNVAVHPDYRGHKIGKNLLIQMMYFSMMQGATKMTLEVRVSNEFAQELYKSVGFKAEGIRPGYYSDDLEDALIMWVNLEQESHWLASIYNDENNDEKDDEKSDEKGDRDEPS